MKKIMTITCIIIGIILILWTVASYIFSHSVASPHYTVLEQRQGYEIRMYDPYITAQVDVSGTYDEALGTGFRTLADYIFGNNTKQTPLAMTAPVTEQEDVSEKMAMTAPVIVSESEKLAMTAPVVERGDERTRTISFVMPFDYTLETLPKPNNPDVKIVPQPARKVAVLRFSWYRGEDRVAGKKQELLDLLARDGVTPQGVPEYAGYNAPFTAPWLNRNEVMVEVE